MSAGMGNTTPRDDGPITKWSGTRGGSDWQLEVEVDCLRLGEPFVCTVWIDGEDEGEEMAALAPLSPEQARELAAALLVVADGVDENNAREGQWAVPERRQDGPR